MLNGWFIRHGIKTKDGLKAAQSAALAFKHI
jgi:hypothetical protein